MWLIWIGLVSFLAGAAYGGEVCYGTLGCFSDEYPWSNSIERPITRLPWSPSAINTRFYLLTRSNPTNYQVISANQSSIAGSNYQSYRKTRFIIHGYIDKGDENWLLDMCKVMLVAEDVNCICVDWKTGGRTLYTQAANNIRVVGAQVAEVITVMKDSFGQGPENVHIIGHSLGAHCAGEAGRRTPGLGRITGLDPAEPYFQGCPPLVRLDPTDATFVDAIHTDGLPVVPYLGFGMADPVGHIDFYPNGGNEMPGCDKNLISQIVDIDGIWEGSRDFVACNHLRSYKYYSESIVNPAGFLGYPCSNYNQFKSGQCFPCGDGACATMGHFADTFRVPNGVENMKFYLNTGDLKPFPRYRYKVSVTIDGSRRNVGYFNVALYSSSENTRQYQIHSGTLTPGKTYELLIDVETNVGDLTYVKFLWNNNVLNPLLPTFGATQITVQRGRDRRVFKFCGKDKVRENILQTLTAC
ncbi:pancreatic triacylglycerol lipase-like [Salminus brasiliensis]|uniref:pancreatic triacylglycerol lipase-like n=1 Tax=Salminus brasiliensis TaxID=930266 RepID=UPI003B8353B9